MDIGENQVVDQALQWLMIVYSQVLYFFMFFYSQVLYIGGLIHRLFIGARVSCIIYRRIDPDP